MMSFGLKNVKTSWLRLDKFYTIINMRNPTNIKEVQQLTVKLVSLSKFSSTIGDLELPYFQCLETNEKF